MPKKREENTTAKFHLTPHSSRRSFTDRKMSMDTSVKRNSPKMMREIHKERHPTIRLSHSGGSMMNRLSMERRASITHLPTNKPSPARNSFR